VRIPIGFWAYETFDSPYVSGQAPYMDKAIEWARATGLKVIVDLHGAPQSQNGYDNSGHKRDTPLWTKGNSIGRTLQVLKTISAKYAQPQYSDVVMGIELLNEPAGYELDMGIIRNFFKAGHKQVRDISKTPVVIHDAFQEPKSYNNMLTKPQDFVSIDHHYYQVFSPEENALSHSQHIKKVCKDIKSMDGANHWTFVGEFSGAMNDCAQYLNGYGVGARYEGKYPDSKRVGSCKGMNDLSSWSQEMKDATRKFLAVQIASFESKLDGWTFWNFKTERSPSWDALQLVDAGVFPELGGTEGAICG
jgi:glucan 1,3-beta-glucosidase